MKRLLTVLLVALCIFSSVSAYLVQAQVATDPSPTTRGIPPTSVATTTVVPATRGNPPAVNPTPIVSPAPEPSPASLSTPTTPAACAAQGVNLLPATLSATFADAQELPTLRTRTSRTFAPKPGAPAKGKARQSGYTAIITAESSNYQDSKGAWQPIDNTLIAATTSGYSEQNTANRYTLSLPTDLSGTPVRLALGPETLDFTLVGAKGTGTLCGTEKQYPNALPGVTLAYHAGNDAVRETLTLASASTPHVFTYQLHLSAGLTAKANNVGGVDITDAKGGLQFAITPPVMDDNAGKHSDAVALTLDASGTTLTLTPGRGMARRSRAGLPGDD